MKVITVINQKGGVGKSTTALALGHGLQAKKYSVLFIDLDAQGNISYTLNGNTDGYNTL
ncbi:ParA family protein, partial [Streptococcus iners]|nr:ParA family protein [Streptococcus suis]